MLVIYVAYMFLESNPPSPPLCCPFDRPLLGHNRRLSLPLVPGSVLVARTSKIQEQTR
uniref:Uncharacterized protein n=1 Tax=Setaria italica TaxID=4555 RepID=K3YP62_SETIT